MSLHWPGPPLETSPSHFLVTFFFRASTITNKDLLFDQTQFPLSPFTHQGPILGFHCQFLQSPVIARMGLSCFRENSHPPQLISQGIWSISHFPASRRWLSHHACLPSARIPLNCLSNNFPLLLKSTLSNFSVYHPILPPLQPSPWH
jgi:hypothetical protein